jgi:UDP-2,3-diacylglucosamine hydrolase
LDAAVPERVDAFYRFLRHESSHCDELYLLGDLTETWIGDDDDSSLAEALEAELRDAGRRCRIRLMHGNRDFLIGDVFAHACGVELIDDPFVIERNGARLLLCHGDSLCTDDVPYQHTRAVLRSRAWQDDVRSKPLSERRLLSNAMRVQSRAANANKPSNIMDAADGAIFDLVSRSAADVIVHGHTHRPGIHAVGGKTVRYVLGDWNRCGWLLRFDGSFSLLCFPLAGRCEI